MNCSSLHLQPRISKVFLDHKNNSFSQQVRTILETKYHFHFRGQTSQRYLGITELLILQLILFTIFSENKPNFCWHATMVHKICKNFKERETRPKGFQSSRLCVTLKMLITSKGWFVQFVTKICDVFITCSFLFGFVLIHFQIKRQLDSLEK